MSKKTKADLEERREYILTNAVVQTLISSSEGSVCKNLHRKLKLKGDAIFVASPSNRDDIDGMIMNDNESKEEDIRAASLQIYPEACSICLETYEIGQEICISSNDDCDHVFHLDCMVDWLLGHEDCPLCRAPFIQPRQQVNDNALPLPVRSSSSERDRGQRLTPSRTIEESWFSVLSSTASRIPILGRINRFSDSDASHTPSYTTNDIDATTSSGSSNNRERDQRSESAQMTTMPGRSSSSERERVQRQTPLRTIEDSWWPVSSSTTSRIPVAGRINGFSYSDASPRRDLTNNMSRIPVAGVSNGFSYSDASHTPSYATHPVHTTAYSGTSNLNRESNQSSTQVRRIQFSEDMSRRR